jgi:hypothetical protein
MKNKLNEIFDEAKPQEIDQFSDELNAPELPDEVLASVKGKVYAKTNLKKEMKTTKSVWLRFGAIAACFLLIVSAVIVVPMLRDDDIGIKPYIPNGDPWSPVIDSSIRDIVLSADEVGNVFDAVMDSNGTNQYTKIYTSLPEYLGITPLPNAEFLPIYSTNKNSPSKSELNDFIVEYLNSATEFFGVNEKNYEIEKDEMPNGDAFFEAEVSENKKGVRFTALNNSLYFYYYSIGERRLEINGEKVSILESDTDEQIKEKLKDTFSFVCASFGKEYSNAKICRYYSQEQLTTIRIYLYSPEETVFPPNFSKAPMTTDYILLTFYTDWGSGTFCDWGGSKDEAFLSEVSVYKAIKPWGEYYGVNAKAKMLTLDDAERLLEKGYVFGGHSCPLCMAAQPEVDFSDYSYVNIEYVYNGSGELCIPFYAFYKYLSETEQGIKTYAKTYVAAIEVSGYEEYFESQKGKHQNSW